MPTLDEILNSDSPVYVINNTKDRGRVLISFADPATGRVQSVPIPVTWIPICISDLVPRDLLKASIDFRNFITRGILKLVDPEEAQRILATPEAQEELRRLYSSQYAKSGADAPVATPEVADEGDEVSPKVQDIVLRLESGSLTPGEAVGTLRSLAPSLTKTDLSFLVANAASDKVRSWAEQELKKRSA